MLTITVFKDELRWSADLRSTAKRLGERKGAKHVWERAKNITDRIDFTQRINLSDSFFEKKSDRRIADDVYSLAKDIANGRHFKTILN